VVSGYWEAILHYVMSAGQGINAEDVRKLNFIDWGYRDDEPLAKRKNR